MTRRSAEPVYREGGPAACLLIHGFAGSPAEIRPLIDYLAGEGLTVAAPLLPGHGTSPEDLRRTRFPMWIRAADAELAALRERCRAVHVIGFSMGGLIALYLAAHHPVDSVVTLAAPVKLNDWRQILVPLGKYLIPYYQSRISNPDIAAQLKANYERIPTEAIHSMLRLARRVRADLPRITAPVLALQGDQDRWVTPDSAAHIVERVSSRSRRLMLLPGRRHFIALEHGREEVCRVVLSWVVEHSG